MTPDHTGDTGLSGSRCQQLRHLLDRVGDTWTLLAVTTLRHGPQRFNELRRALPGVSSRMLARTLRGLERDGLVARSVFATVPPQVEYALTPLGSGLLEPVDALFAWALAHRGQMDAARQAYDQQHGADE